MVFENVINNKTGFLVQEYDFENMVEKIIYLLKIRVLVKAEEQVKYITKLWIIKIGLKIFMIFHQNE